jgi:3-dehydroquinate synthase
MKTLQQSFSVPFHYAIHFTNGLFKTQNPLLKEVLGNDFSYPKKILFFIDEEVSKGHPQLVTEIQEYCATHLNNFDSCDGPVIIPGGEQVKNGGASMDLVLNKINRHGVDRQSYVIAIGGGAVLDMVGYVASIAHRGVRHIRIPTTVLSQNDSGIGVKNSINAFGKKNFLGNFAPPYAVLNDFNFLETLNDRDWRSGISEAIKVALIKDIDFFNFIRIHAEDLRNRKIEPMKQLIHRCAEMHMEHIGGSDPFEMGSSRPLDFGHWAAHKLEQMTHYKLRHGEAVAIGIAMDTVYSYLSGMISKTACEKVTELIKELGFKLYIPEMKDTGALINGLKEFKEHLGGNLTIMLLSELGQGMEVHVMNPDIITESISLLKKYQGQELNAVTQTVK